MRRRPIIPSIFRAVRRAYDAIASIPVMGQMMRLGICAWSVTRALYLKFLRKRYWLSDKVRRDAGVIQLRRALETCWREQEAPYQLPDEDRLEHGWGGRLHIVLGAGRRATYLVCMLAGALLMLLLRPAPSGLLVSFTLVGVATTVLAIGLPLVTAYSGLRTGGQWGREYLFRSTGLAWFAVLTALTAVLGVICHEVLVIAAASDAPAAVIAAVMFAGGVLGLVIATLVQLMAIILEIIHFAKNPCFVWAATGHLAAQRVLESILSNVYNHIFIKTRDRILDEQCDGLQGVRGPGEYISEAWFSDGSDVRIRCRLRMATESVDVYLPAVPRLAGAATQAGGTLCLAPHSRLFMAPDGQSISIGKMVPVQTAPMAVDPAWFCGRADFCHSWPLQRTDNLRDTFVGICGQTLEQNDQYGFLMLMHALRDALIEFADIWQSPQIRGMSTEDADDQAKMDMETAVDWHRWANIHREVLTQILHHQPRVDRTPYRQCSRFLDCLQESWLDLMQKCANLGKPETLEILLGYVPVLYQTSKDHAVRLLERETGSGNEEVVDGLIKRSARWGRFLASPDSYLDSLPKTVTAAERWRILIFLHISGSRWLRQILVEPPHAGTWRKQALCEELCEGLGKMIALAESWKATCDSPADLDEILRARHWCLLGDLILQAARRPEDVSERMIAGLCHESLTQCSPEDLLRYYARNRTVDEMSHWHADLRPDERLTEEPLSGMILGGARSVPQHGEKMRRALLWLIAESGGEFRRGNLPPFVPIRLDVEAFRAILQDMQKLEFLATSNARGLRLPRDGEHWILEWLSGCHRAFEDELDEKIAQATALPERMDDFRDEFRKSFETWLVVAKFLVRTQAFTVDHGASAGPGRVLVSKKEFLEPADEGHGNNSGGHQGAMFARGIDYALVDQFINKGRQVGRMTRGTESGDENGAASLSDGPDLLKALEGAVEWLRSRQCRPSEGLICVATDSYVEQSLRSSEHFEPSWQDADQPPGFAGRYSNYLVWRKPVEEGTEGVVAVDARDWQGLHVQERVLHGRWHDTSVRELTDEDLRKIESECKGRDEEFDATKYRQYCLFECRLLLSLAVSDVADHVAVFCKRPNTASNKSDKE